MLKIKDDVDLKELEKFGFEYDKYTKEFEKDLVNEYSCLDIDTLMIGESRIIYNITELETLEDNWYYNGVLEDDNINKIKDLIQAGLVEKVVEQMIKMKFIGTSSNDFENGNVYTLVKFDESVSKIRVYITNKYNTITVIYYSSLNSFNRNWKVVE